MARPSDWHVLGIDGDPTPGSPSAIRGLARRFGDVADDAEYAETKIRQLLGDEAIGKWVGEAGKAFRAKTDDLPGQLKKCKDSYRMASDALTWWAGRLAVHQGDADAALVKGRTAASEVAEARSKASTASGGVDAAAGAEVLRPAFLRPPGAVAPTPEQVSAARSKLESARAAQASADAAVAAAEGRLAAARRLALDAAELRNDDADTTKRKIHDASDAGIEERSRWQKFKDGVAEAWDVIIKIAKVVVAVLGIVALIIGGPLAWVVLAAALLVLADTLMKYAKGEASLWDVAFAALSCIPMTKGLTTLAALKTAFKSGGLLGAGAHILSAGKTALVGMAGAIRALGGRMSMAIRQFTASGILSLTLRFGRPADMAADLANTAIHAPNMYLPGGMNVGALHLPSDGPVGDLLAGYDRFGGMTADDFARTWGDGHGGYNWDLVPNQGFAGDRVPMTMNPGEVMDRFGPPDGRFLSPPGTPFPERGLPPSSIDGATPGFGYHQYEVVQPFTADVGYIADAMGQPGGGLQIFLDGAHVPASAGERFNVQWLLDKGYIKELPL